MASELLLSLRLGAVLAEQVPREVVDALLSVQVSEGVGQPGGFRLSFGMGKRSLLFRELLPSGALDPPARAQIVVTIRGQATVLMDGVVTRHDVTPSAEPGQARLTLTGEDVSRMMDIVDLTGVPYVGLPPEARVAMICARYPMYGLVPKIVPSVYLATPNPLESVPAQQGTDLAYVKALAAQAGYHFSIEPGPAPGVNFAYWGPLVKAGPPQPALWANADATTNVETLTFTFDGFSATQYVALIQEPVTKFPVPVPIPDITPVNPPMGARKPLPLKASVVRGLAKLSPLQAAGVALARAADGYEVIGGQGTLDVLRYGRPLRARRPVTVRGASPGYDGTYFVKSVTHDITRGAYTQQFTLTRNAFLPLP